MRCLGFRQFCCAPIRFQFFGFSLDRRKPASEAQLAFNPIDGLFRNDPPTTLVLADQAFADRLINVFQLFGKDFVSPATVMVYQVPEALRAVFLTGTIKFAFSRRHFSYSTYYVEFFQGPSTNIAGCQNILKPYLASGFAQRARQPVLHRINSE
jgi:hypothetical protein